MRTTITLDKDVRTRLQQKMRKTGKTFKEVVNETLRDGFAAEKSLKSRKPFKVKAFSLGLRPGVNFDKPWVLLEELEGPDYR